MVVENINDDSLNTSDNVNLHNNIPQNVFYAKRRPSVVNNYPENQTDFKQRSTVKIICDSIPKRIQMREFNNILRKRHIEARRTQLKSFPGTTISQLKHYSLPTLQEENPDTVINKCGNQ